MARPIELVTLHQIASRKRVADKLARSRLRRAIDSGKNVPSTVKETQWIFRKKDASVVASLIAD